MKTPRSHGYRTQPSHDLVERELTETIIGAFYDVYNALGFGFLESVYVRALQVELKARGIRSQREAAMEVTYRDEQVGFFRADLVVEQRVIVEVKSMNAMAEPEQKQLLNYLKATETEVGLLLNFGPRPRFVRLVSSNALKHRGRTPTKA
jgi:GxxExxY protein